MGKKVEALFCMLGILVSFLIFSSIFKDWLFSSEWFQTGSTVFPTVFYSALIDFAVLIVLYSLIHTVKLYMAAFNDDATFLSGIFAALIGWLSILFLSLSIGFFSPEVTHSDSVDKSTSYSSFIVFLTLAIIVISCEILLRGFMFQFLAKATSDKIAIFTLSFFVALLSGPIPYFSIVELINIFLFNVILCLMFIFFRDLWMPTTFALSFYLSAFFAGIPLRELSFLDRPNLLTGVEKSWFGSEITIFSGFPLMFILLLICLTLLRLERDKRFIPLIVTEEVTKYKARSKLSTKTLYEDN